MLTPKVGRLQRYKDIKMHTRGLTFLLVLILAFGWSNSAKSKETYDEFSDKKWEWADEWKRQNKTGGIWGCKCDNPFYLGVSSAYILYDGSVGGVDIEGAGFGIRIHGGVELLRFLALEATVTRSYLEPKGSSRESLSKNMDYLAYDLTTRFQYEYKNWLPFISVGFGQHRITANLGTSDVSTSSFTYVVRAGVDVLIKNNFSIRTTYDATGDNTQAVTLGVMYRF